MVYFKIQLFKCTAHLFGVEVNLHSQALDFTCCNFTTKHHRLHFNAIEVNFEILSINFKFYDTVLGYCKV